MATSGCRESVADGLRTAPKSNLRRANADWYIETMARLAPIHRELTPDRADGWLSEHHELGQTFAQYARDPRRRMSAKRRSIVLQPIGVLSPDHTRIVHDTAAFLRRFFGVSVRIAAPLGVAQAPTWATRRSSSGDTQLHTRWLLRDVLPDRLSSDAAAVIGLTNYDLWPGEGWAHVIGQATFTRRVGVWSMFRLGDPGASEFDYLATLVRTMKVAAHELGHVFGIRHCTAWRCLMNGSHDRDEMDRHPLTLCPEDAAKVAWATGANPLERYESLREITADLGLQPESRAYRWAVRMLRTTEPAERAL